MSSQKESDLGARLNRLEDIEAIRRLKYNYTWFLDHKMWDEYKNLMADGMVYVGTGHEVGKEQFIEIVSKHLANLVTSHQLHQSLIDITSSTTARAVWCLRDDLSNSAKGTKFKGRAYYTEDYVKVNGEWKIKKIVLEYLCTEGSATAMGT
ncbi:MAG: nuclear transport factor 2 family protein, partial [Georgfuchsia sp.]